MNKTTKALKKQAATAQSVAQRNPDTFLSGQMTTIAFRAQADVLKQERKKKK